MSPSGRTPKIKVVRTVCGGERNFGFNRPVLLANHHRKRKKARPSEP
jgi:hypothetical protein